MEEIKMKKRITRLRVWVVISCILFSLIWIAGCSSHSETEINTVATTGAEELDNLIIPNYNPLSYYNGLLYYLQRPLGAAPTRIYYIDPETGESGLLCGKPDCTHDNADCNACIDSPGNTFTVYQDRIYWCTKSISNRKLFCEDIDGTNRREVMALDKESEWFVSDKSFIAIYNDTLYRCGDGNTVTDGEPSYNMLLYCQPLQKDSKPRHLYSVENVRNVVTRIYGDQLYFAIIGADNDLSICVCDLESSEVKELFHKENADNSPADIAVHDNKLILHGFGYCVCIYSLTDGSYTVIGEDGKNYYAATGTKIYEPISNNGYRLHKLNGELIGTGKEKPTDFEEDNYTKQYLGSLGETMLFLWTVYSGSEKMPGLAAIHSYIAAFNTDTLEWKILWDGISDYEGM